MTTPAISYSQKRPSARELVPYALLAILALAAFLRLVGLNWDANQHLHPDERFLTMVETALGWPQSLKEYLDTSVSPLNPHNRNFGLFVYGTLPIFLVKRVGMALDQNGYDQIFLVGRALSAVADLIGLCLLYAIARRLYGGRVALLAAALFACAVLPIQQSHFFTVDTFASTLSLLAIYYAVRISEEGRIADYVGFGVAFGMTLACRINLVFLAIVAPLAAGIVLSRRLRAASAEDVPLRLESVLFRLALAAVISFFVFRFFQPYAFKGPGFFNLSLNPQWLDNMKEVRRMSNGEMDFPPGHQWANRTAWVFPWTNMVVWGMGPLLGLTAWAGWAFVGYELFARRRWRHLMPWAWVAVLFGYQGMQFVKTMRYFLPLYPILIMLAAYLLIRAWDAAGASARSWRVSLGRWSLSWSRREARWAAGAAIGVVVAATFLYALAFVTIYMRPHSRVAASQWIFDHVPAGARLGNEHWDDPLPLRLPGRDAGVYHSLQSSSDGMMQLYGEDTPEKLEQLLNWLDEADYIILSSNRLYGSIPRLPMRFPMTTRYYQLLFSGELGFEQVQRVTSYPGLFGIQIVDDGAEEAFTVYDHPQVTIFRKGEGYSRTRARALLGDVDWDSILRVPARNVAKVRGGLVLDRELWRTVYQKAGTWAALFAREGLSARAPVLVWALLVELIGLLAFPLTFLAFGRLRDRGYILSKALGLLLVAWGGWLLASLRLVPWSAGLLWGMLAALALASGVLAWRIGPHLAAFVRREGRLLAVEEALFWGFFGVFLLIRWGNPDLWHPVMGGEKPMDFAYLNAIVKSAYFPPYDPWFAGGYINYYYFGFVLVAALIKLTRIAPAVAYNLAVPTIFAMTATGAFVVAYNLAEGWRARAMAAARRAWEPLAAGGLGALFVTVIGNLGEIKLICEGFRDVSRVDFPTTIPGLLTLVRVIDGARQVIFEGRALPFRIEWWYWNATRVIPHPPTEAVPITEFPFFTFLYADLHAHMMALPYTLMALAFAVNLVRGGIAGGPGEAEKADAASARGLRWVRERLAAIDGGEAATLALLGLVVGALWPMNTWDFPTYAALAAAALVWREHARRGHIDGAALWSVAWRWGALIAIAFLAFLPFHRNYARAYSSVELWKGSRTPLWAYLTIHGFFLFVLVTYLLSELRAGRDHHPLAHVLQLAWRRWYALRRLRHWHRVLVRPSPWYHLALSALATVGYVLLGLIVFKQFVFALALVVIVLAGLLALSPRPDPRRQFVLTLIALGAALTLVVEIVVLKGDISRMNTVFKFYLQVWVMWGVAAAASLPILWERLERRRSFLQDDESAAVGSAASTAGGLWQATFVLLLACCLLYPVLATRAKIEDRFEPAVGRTLNGMAYMEQAVYYDQDQAIILDWDRQAIVWLQQNVVGSPAIVEANTPLYRWGSRVSIYTGLPTIIGWDWHQRQQRAVLPGEVIDRRLNDVATIYADPDIETTRRLLRRYDVTYIYVGALERLYYGAGVVAKFDRYDGVEWDLVYENPEVRIYQVRRAG